MNAKAGVGLFADPLLVRAARREKVERPPAWMMRQAGRYMASYRKLAEKFPSFRQRSETTDLIVEISLQPWEAFRPDGVIIFSDILTPLPAIGISFEIDEAKGPILERPIRTEEGLQAFHKIDLEKVNFVGQSLSILRKEVCISSSNKFLHMKEDRMYFKFNSWSSRISQMVFDIGVILPFTGFLYCAIELLEQSLRWI